MADCTRRVFRALREEFADRIHGTVKTKPHLAQKRMSVGSPLSSTDTWRWSPSPGAGTMVRVYLDDVEVMTAGD